MNNTNQHIEERSRHNQRQSWQMLGHIVGPRPYRRHAKIGCISHALYFQLDLYDRLGYHHWSKLSSSFSSVNNAFKANHSNFDARYKDRMVFLRVFPDTNLYVACKIHVLNTYNALQCDVKVSCLIFYLLQRCNIRCFHSILAKNRHQTCARLQTFEFAFPRIVLSSAELRPILALVMRRVSWYLREIVSSSDESGRFREPYWRAGSRANAALTVWIPTKYLEQEGGFSGGVDHDCRLSVLSTD